MGYVGEWHSHPLPCGPSGQDTREVRRISTLTPHPVALIVLTPMDGGGWGASAWIAVRGAASQTELAAI